MHISFPYSNLIKDAKSSYFHCDVKLINEACYIERIIHRKSLQRVISVIPPYATFKESANMKKASYEWSNACAFFHFYYMLWAVIVNDMKHSSINKIPKTFTKGDTTWWWAKHLYQETNAPLYVSRASTVHCASLYTYWLQVSQGAVVGVLTKQLGHNFLDNGIAYDVVVVTLIMRLLQQRR